MAVSTGRFNKFPKHLMQGEVPDLSDNNTPTVVKCALLDTVPAGTEDVWNDVNANEITGANYVAGGQALSNKTLNESSGVTTFDADNPVWPESTIDARAAVIYEESTGYLISYVDFGEIKHSDNGEFTVIWDDTSGIFSATV